MVSIAQTQLPVGVSPAAELSPMDTIFSQVDFAPAAITPLDFYQILKSVPSMLMYRELRDDLEYLACVLLNDRYLNDIKAIALVHDITITAIHDISESRLDEIKAGTYPDFLDGFDTRSARYWSGPRAGFLTES